MFLLSLYIHLRVRSICDHLSQSVKLNFPSKEPNLYGLLYLAENAFQNMAFGYYIT